MWQVFQWGPWDLNQEQSAFRAHCLSITLRVPSHTSVIGHGQSSDGVSSKGRLLWGLREEAHAKHLAGGVTQERHSLCALYPRRPSTQPRASKSISFTAQWMFDEQTNAQIKNAVSSKQGVPRVRTMAWRSGALPNRVSLSSPYCPM